VVKCITVGASWRHIEKKVSMVDILEMTGSL